MVKKVMNAKEKAREKILIGILLTILPAGIRAFNLDLGALGLFINALGLVGVVVLIIGIAGLIGNPKK